jgi:hypothetical protein
VCSQVHQLHLTWFDQVLMLRQAYSQAGTPQSEWRVSTEPGARRNRELEPNVGWLIIEYRRVNDDGMDTTAAGRAHDWEEEGRDY